MRHHSFKSAAIIHRLLAKVVAEYLLIQVAEQMERLYAHIGSLEATLEQAPEILHPIGVNAPVNVTFRVINDFVSVALLSESHVGHERIGVDMAARCDVLLNLSLNVMLAATRNDS